MVIMDLPKRKSSRIPGYDYASANYYFITICTHEKRCIFGKPGMLNWMGKCTEACLLKIEQLHPQIRIDKYVIMPNHIHVIFDVQENDGKQNLAMIIGQYKMAAAKKIRERKPGFEVWQRSFHDHVIRDQRSYEKIWNYIENNPLKWENDCFYVASEEDDCLREGQ